MFLGYRPPCMCGLEYPEQAHDILPKRTAAYRKTTELLHTQLVRKGRMRRWMPTYKEGAITFGSLLVGGEKKNITSFNHPTYGEVYTTEFYDIKSPSKNPYNKDSHDDLGLNQYFVGQSPYEYYKGDPGDDKGIYHDTSQIRGPARWEVSQCDTYSYTELLSGKNLKFPFKIYEKITETTGFDKKTRKAITKTTITGYEVEVIALIDHWENKIVDKEKSDIEDRKVYKDVSTSIYALKDGGILVYSSQYGIYEALTFYASGNMKDQPTNLKKFVENWDKYYRLYVKEDVDGWVSALQIVLGVVGIAGFMFAPVIAPALGYASAGFGFALGTISVALSAVSIGALAAGDAKVSKIFGILSGITGLAGALKNIFSTVGSNVASSGASTLSAASTASKMGMRQTSSLYLGSGAMNGAGASKLTSMSFSEVLKASNMSFNEAIKVSVSGIESSLEASLWSSTMDALKSSYKIYSNTKDVFKSANDFGDDEIPNNDDKEVKTPVALRFNGSLESMVGYSKEGADDIGLMEGST
ncbi:MAG: hypothetical protein MSA79_00355 [Campylobacter sp.]|nr:hypothetical protein [Campylobacter sp.]